MDGILCIIPGTDLEMALRRSPGLPEDFSCTREELLKACWYIISQVQLDRVVEDYEIAWHYWSVEMELHQDCILTQSTEEEELLARTMLEYARYVVSKYNLHVHLHWSQFKVEFNYGDIYIYGRSAPGNCSY